MSDIIIDNVENDYNELNDNNNFDINNDNSLLDDTTNESPSLKNGVKLPTSTNDWDIANTYFRSNLPISQISENYTEETVKRLNHTVYNYFKDNFGLVDSAKEDERNCTEMYKNFTKDQLKKELKQSKNERSPSVLRIRFVSRMLRAKATSSPMNKVYSIDHDLELKNNFWSYVKHYLEKPTKVLSTFNQTSCYEFFKKSVKCANPTKKFQIPSWIPFFPSPEKEFDSNPRTYAEISQIIKRMKTSGSPCPLDQISIISYKRCPYLRSYLTAIIAEIWKKKVIPPTWKKAITILIYKKGSTDNPGNFRSITLETVTLKILTSALRYKVCQFLSSKNYIETNIQKGFVNGISGTFEHTCHLAHEINNARKSPQSLIVTLLDLSNAFGKVHHNLIDCVLEHHHVPEDI